MCEPHIAVVCLRNKNLSITNSPCACKDYLQGVSIACYAEPSISYNQVVRPSVHPSITRWHWVKTMQARVTKSSPSNSARTPIFGVKRSSRNLKGFTPSEGIKWEWGRKNSQFSANKSPYLRNGARSKLLLMANRKSHMPFRLVPKSTTLDDLERPIRRKDASFGGHHKNWMKRDPYYQQQKCRHWL